MHHQVQREISYIQGMLSSSSQKDSLEHQAILRLLKILDNCVTEYHDLQVRLNEMSDYVEAIDEDLDEMEKLLYDEEMYSISCSECGEEVFVEEEDLEDEEFELSCPNCQEVLLEAKVDEQEAERIE